MICKTSGYPIVEVVSSTSAKVNIPVLDRVFSEFGIPKVLGSDNGPPFQGKDFADYCSYMGIRHERATPYWPRGNAKCERFMKSLGKTVRIAQIEGKPWRQVMNQFLRSYRAAPHASTGFSPNQLMFGRNVSSRLPSVETQSPSATLEAAVNNYAKSAEKNRIYGDKKLNTKPSIIKPGDSVLVRQPKINKLTYKPEKLKVVARNGSWVLAKGIDGHKIERNVSFFKLLPESEQVVPAAKPQDPESNESSPSPSPLPSSSETSNSENEEGQTDKPSPSPSAVTSSSE